MHQYTYRKSIELFGDIDDILFKMTDLEEMKKWQLNLTEIELIEGHQFDKGLKCVLHYVSNGNVMKIFREVLELDLPKYFKVTYEVLGVKNICINRFDIRGNDVMWHMDVTFDFEEEPLLPQNMFEDQTYLNMILFKEFLET